MVGRQSRVFRSTSIGREIGIVLALCALLILPLLEAPACAASSDFSSGLDGWTSNTSGEIAWQSAGGNPGGYIRFADGSGNTTEVRAPAKFLGNWSSFDGSAALSYDHAIFAIGTGSITFLPYRVVISGPGGSAIWQGTSPTGTTGWQTQTVPIQQAAWTVSTGTWQGLIANVTQLAIRMEIVSNSSPPSMGDIEGIDNVQLVPEPSSALGILCGLSAAWRLRRRRSR